jgi:hypothetical protein
MSLHHEPKPANAHDENVFIMSLHHEPKPANAHDENVIIMSFIMSLNLRMLMMKTSYDENVQKLDEQPDMATLRRLRRACRFR